MTLVIETGLGVSGANTFIDSTFADSYFSDRNNALWTGTTAVKQAAIISAAQFLNGLRWKGTRVDPRHTMCWPRFGVPIEDWTVTGHSNGLPAWASYGMYWSSTEVPIYVQYGQCEAALRYIQGTDMMPDLDRGGLTKIERVGPITTEYMSGAPAGVKFQSVMAWIRPFIKSSNTLELMRS